MKIHKTIASLAKLLNFMLITNALTLVLLDTLQITQPIGVTFAHLIVKFAQLPKFVMNANLDSKKILNYFVNAMSELTNFLIMETVLKNRTARSRITQIILLIFAHLAKTSALNAKILLNALNAILIVI